MDNFLTPPSKIEECIALAAQFSCHCNHLSNSMFVQIIISGWLPSIQHQQEMDVVNHQAIVVAGHTATGEAPSSTNCGHFSSPFLSDFYAPQFVGNGCLPVDWPCSPLLWVCLGTSGHLRWLRGFSWRPKRGRWDCYSLRLWLVDSFTAHCGFLPLTLNCGWMFNRCVF